MKEYQLHNKENQNSVVYDNKLWRIKLLYNFPIRISQAEAS